MIVNDYFNKTIVLKSDFQHLSFGEYFKRKSGSKINPDIALIGISEHSDIIRQHFYKLFIPKKSINCIDFGNLKKCKTKKDKYFAIRDIHSYCTENNINLFIIGNASEEVEYIYQAIASLKKNVNITAASPILHFTTNYRNQNNYFINKIIRNPKNYLDLYANIGYQQYFVSHEDIISMRKVFFEALRLGLIKNDITLAEPYIRDADTFLIDTSCIKYSESPANNFISPNGIFANEACQLAKYAGSSLINKSLFIYGFNLKKDINHQTAILVSQIIWYYIQGFYSRLPEESEKPGSNDMIKFIIPVDSENQNLVFYKNKISEKWWIEIPYGKNKKKLISCCYSDYKQACENEIPERWLTAFQRLN
ncbi:MAG: formimidoylglutamase [Marinilabiliales bacterium]